MSLSRNSQIDTLRGLLLVLMTVDHMLLWPFESWQALHSYTYNPLGYFSAAEGFFFLSGILAGALAAQKSGSFLKHLPRRIIKLYSLNFLCIAFIMFCVWFFPNLFSAWSENSWMKAVFSLPGQALILSIFFLCSPPFFDILPVYCLFFMCVPLAIKMITNNKTLVLLFISFSLFVAGQFAPVQTLEAVLREYISPVVTLAWFDIFSWQLLFTLAVCCGYFFANHELLPSIKTPKNATVAVAMLFCAVCFVFRHDLVGFGDILGKWTDVRTLGPLRLMNFLAAALLTRVLLIKTPFLQINILARLGEKSLYVFVYHSLLIYFMGLFVNEIGDMNFWPKASLFVLSIASLWLPVVFLQTSRAHIFTLLPARKARGD